MLNTIQVIGIILTIIGLYVLLTTSGIVLPELSFVSAGPITIGDISEENATKLFVGSIVLIVGMGLILKGSGKH